MTQEFKLEQSKVRVDDWVEMVAVRSRRTTISHFFSHLNRNEVFL